MIPSIPRFATIADYLAAPPAPQRAFWAGVLAQWQRNAEAEQEADVASDYEAARRDRDWWRRR